MSRAAVDTEKLRVALRRMNRGRLLIVAERAIEIVPRAKLRQLVGDMVRIEELADEKPGSASLLDEVKKFHEASLRHEYYDSFDVNSKNYMEKSKGTEAFLAECGRLIGKCVRAVAKGPHRPLREAFEVLFALLRRIDEDSDSVVFFADEGGSWQVGADWREVLPAYFRCLVEGASGDEFAREVDRSITDFADYDRRHQLTAARRVASTEQKAALRRRATPQGRSPRPGT
jgi:hypothetical protein